MALPRLLLKDSVKINGRHFDHEVRLILDVARESAPDMQQDAVWITSANDSKHKNGSLHYKNQAFDIRIWNIAGDDPDYTKAKEWATRMQAALGADYDVLFEDDHIHAEYDPKET